VDDFALTPAERALFAALRARGVKFLIIGMGAAVLEGAPVATQDIDLWFESVDTDWLSGFGMQPQAFGGDGLSRIDVVLTAHGLGRFEDEYAGGVEREIEGRRGQDSAPRSGHRQQTGDVAAQGHGGLTRPGATLRARDGR
jgi:hypothetical protein